MQNQACTVVKMCHFDTVSLQMFIRDNVNSYPQCKKKSAIVLRKVCKTALFHHCKHLCFGYETSECNKKPWVRGLFFFTENLKYPAEFTWHCCSSLMEILMTKTTSIIHSFGIQKTCNDFPPLMTHPGAYWWKCNRRQMKENMMKKHFDWNWMSLLEQHE